jgi:hypothetical protein
LILDRTRTLGLSRTELVRRLGYSNLAGGHKVLTGILRTGIVPKTTDIARHLAAALDVEDSFLVSVIEATEWQLRDEYRAQVLAREAGYRATFRPHLRTETARTRPEPLFISALVGVSRLRHVPIPDDVWSLRADERDAQVKRTILDHFRAQHGCIPTYGEIVGYTLVTLPGYLVDFGIPFGLNGDCAGPMFAVQRLLQATLGTKRGDTRLTGLLSDAPIQTIRVDGQK